MVNYYDALLASKLSGGSATLQEKSVSITANGDSTILPDSGYDGISKVNVSVNVSGGGEAPENDVEFIDYDGTIVYSYTAEQFLALDAMPANPTHEGLTAQGWNWSLADAKEYVGDYGGLVIGQTYDTVDGSMNIYVTLPSTALAPYLGICPNGTAVIDWGDGSPTDTLTGTSTSTLQQIQHTYAAAGDYKINVKMQDDGEMGINGASSVSYLLRSTSGTVSNNTNYITKIKEVNLGSQVTKLGEFAFCYCFNIERISVCNHYSPMYSGCFEYTASLEALVLPSGWNGSGNSGFFTSGIKYISIPKSMTGLGSNAFSFCSRLKKIYFPTNVTMSGETFRYCSSLTKIIGTRIYNSNNVATECPNLREVTVRADYGYTLTGDYSLKKATIYTSEGTSIGERTFLNCYSLPNITIPTNITSIAAYAFGNCFSMEYIKFERTTPPTVSASNVFQNLPTDCKIYVPYSEDHSVLNAYKTATNYPNPSTYTYVEY